MFACSRVLNMRICFFSLFYLIVHGISTGFGLLLCTFRNSCFYVFFFHRQTIKHIIDNDNHYLWSRDYLHWDNVVQWSAGRNYWRYIAKTNHFSPFCCIREDKPHVRHRQQKAEGHTLCCQSDNKIQTHVHMDTYNTHWSDTDVRPSPCKRCGFSLSLIQTHTQMKKEKCHGQCPWSALSS